MSSQRQGGGCAALIAILIVIALVVAIWAIFFVAGHGSVSGGSS